MRGTRRDYHRISAKLALDAESLNSARTMTQRRKEEFIRNLRRACEASLNEVSELMVSV